MISLLILFFSVERILENNSTPRVVQSSSSSLELEDSHSDILVIFFLRVLDCMAGPLRKTLGGEGDASLNETWPCMYVLSVVIRLLADSMATLKDSRPHESFTNRTSDMNIFLTPLQQSTRRHFLTSLGGCLPTSSSNESFLPFWVYDTRGSLMFSQGCFDI